MVRPMGTTAYGGKGSKERAANGHQPIGAASCKREQYTKATCQPPPPLFLGPPATTRSSPFLARMSVPKVPDFFFFASVRGQRVFHYVCMLKMLRFRWRIQNIENFSSPTLIPTLGAGTHHWRGARFLE